MPKKVRRTKKTLLALASAAAMCLALSGCAGGVSDDQVKQDVQSSSIVSNGLVPSSYVEESPYEVTELKVGKQQDETASGIEARRVEFSGKIANANFESSFSGHAYYTKQGDSWMNVTGPTTDAGSTVPLKGVDSMTTNASMADNEKLENFESTFEQGEGSYTAKATQKTLIEGWFANDEVTTEQNFVFNSDEGWKQSGEPQVTGTTTTYKLAGKQFTCTTEPSIWNNEGKVTYSITFKDVAEDGAATADYAIDYDPAGADGKFSGTLNAVHETGEATGKMDRKTGSSSFSVELNDPKKKVTFNCKSASATVSAGTGTVNAMNVEVITELRYGSNEGAVLSSGGLSGSDTFVENLG